MSTHEAKLSALDAGEVSAEKLFTLREIAEQLNIHYFKIQRAARAGLFPTYSLFNKRRLARISEVVAAIELTRSGGVR